MLADLRSVTPLLLSTVFLLMGVSLLHTEVALHGETLGFSVAMLGTLTSMYYVGFLLGTYIAPKLTHRIGHIRAFAFCTVSLTIVVLLQSIGSVYEFWLVLRVLQGMTLVGMYAIIESWLNATAAPRHRSMVFSIYMMLNLGASAGAQQFLRLSNTAFVLFCVVAVMFCLASLPVIATRQPQPDMSEVPRVQVKRFYRLVPTALVSALISGLVLGAFWGLLPLYAHANGYTVSEIGVYMSVAIVGGVALQLPLGRFADRIDRRMALAVISAMAAIVALANLMVPADHRTLAMVLVFAFGGMSFAVYPIAVAHLVDYLQRGELLSASSTVLLVNGLGSAIGPLLAGALMTLGQPWLLFAWFAALNSVLAGYALYRYATRKREVTATDHFVPMVHTTPGAMDLHPETET